MWKWYKCARECFVYLTDVHSLDHGPAAVRQRVMQSQWFTRGWTLQELIAPTSLVFCNNRWEIIGTRDSFVGAISAVSGIPRECLFVGDDSWGAGSDARQQGLERMSVAAKMSWAAHRSTTREEDHAYCLLGLFGVHMSLLYGEGREKAFKRLQLEIIKDSDDESIFAWSVASGLSFGPPLAKSLELFSRCGRIRKNMDPKSVRSLPYAMTNKGLEFHSVAEEYDDPVVNVNLLIVPLMCFSPSDSQYYIVLQTLNGYHMRWTRTYTEAELKRICLPAKRKSLGLKQYYIHYEPGKSLMPLHTLIHFMR